VGVIVDSSVLIAAERGKLDLDATWAKEGKKPLAIAAITASELLHGVHRAVEPSQRMRREAYVEGLFAQLSIIPFDLVVARTHARLGAELASKGCAVGPHDLLIAATAIASGYEIATRDRRSFPRIPGVNVLFW
jgi:tRNA(fMet)-specific endonuclease VapC